MVEAGVELPLLTVGELVLVLVLVLVVLFLFVLFVFVDQRVGVQIQLPKFHLETSLTLTEMLPKLGIVRAFSDFADFSLISNQRLKVSDALHKAVITVSLFCS